MNSKMGLKNERQDSQITIFARARLKDELSFEKKVRAADITSEFTILASLIISSGAL